MKKEEELNIEAQEALMTSKLSDLKKKINADSWNKNMELLIKAWGEKAAGLRFMHQHSAGIWKKFSDNLSLWSIGITSISSGVSLAAASINDEESKNIILYIIGTIGVISTALQSVKKFYNSEEKSADHGSIAKQFGTFYRYLTLQMTLTRSDRLPSNQLSEYCLKEYERLQLEAPNISGESIQLFKTKFKNSEQAIPDICEDKFIIKIYNDKEVSINETLDNTIDVNILSH